MEQANEKSTSIKKINHTSVTASDSVLKQMNTNFSDKQDDMYMNSDLSSPYSPKER